MYQNTGEYDFSIQEMAKLKMRSEVFLAAILCKYVKPFLVRECLKKTVFLPLHSMDNCVF